MHIQLLRTRYPHWGTYSGINQFLKYIDQKHYQIEMWLVSDSDEDFPVKNSLIQEWLRQTIQERGMQWYKLSDLTAELRTLKQSYRQKIDIIHYLDGEHSAQFLPRLLRPLCKDRPKMIATYHQPPELLDSLIIKDIVTQLDYITVVSPEQVTYFNKFVAPDKIRLILHGIDTGYFRPAKVPKEKGRFKCITVGYYLRDYKTLRTVAKKLSSFKNIEFQVVSSQAVELEGLTNVTRYSGIDDASLLKLYQQADLLFLPLVQSTANNALLEGIACGLPIVSTDLPSVKAYLPGQEAILVKDNDPEQFIEAILHLVNNSEDREDMMRAARKRAEELDWRNIAPEYEVLYAKLASSC